MNSLTRKKYFFKLEIHCHITSAAPLTLQMLENYKNFKCNFHFASTLWKEDKVSHREMVYFMYMSDVCGIMISYFLYNMCFEKPCQLFFL